MVWHCCKCDSVNVDSFTFNSYELYTTNFFSPLSGTDCSIDTLNSTAPFSPLHTSSPHRKKDFTKTTSISDQNSRNVNTNSMNEQNQTTETSNLDLPNKSNLRLLTVNCCSIREHKSEFTAALDYVKPDLICGTESWLRGIQPGKEPSKSAIKTCEIFPDSYIIHRNDRMSRGGGVFTGINKQFIADEQTQLVTECEIIWSKVKMKNNRDLYLSSFYMPHRNMNDLRNLDSSLEKLSEHSKSKHIFLAGDFNCPDIDWETLTVRQNAQDREIQQYLIDISVEHGLTQVHDQPTRQENILDLVFTDNPSLVKHSQSIPGISDHAMVVTDSDVKPVYNKQKPRKVYLFSKANWNKIYEACENLSTEIIGMARENLKVESIWEKFKTGIQSTMDNFIPSKTFKKKSRGLIRS